MIGPHDPAAAPARGLRVLDRLGSSPQGTLYQAEYPEGEKVALLVLRSEAPGEEPLVSEQFARATSIQHPNVAAVYELGRMADGAVYVVLEQVDGEPLADLLTSDQVLALGEAVDLVLQLAAGLRAACREGFIHGNLSPYTILVTRAPFSQPQVKLNGLSLQSAFQNREAQPPSPDGPSAGYASPERLAGLPPDERSEVFSLGAVLHHLLTGTHPEAGQVDASVPRIARRVLGTALAPAPDRRYQTIAELHEALTGLASKVANPRRAVMDRRLLAAAVAAGAVVIGGIGLFSDSRTSPRSVESAKVAAPSREPPAPPGPAAPVERPVPQERPMRKVPRERSADSPAVPERKDRTADETPEPLGYAPESRPPSVAVPPPRATPPPVTRARPQARPARVLPPARTTADPRSRAELEQDQGLRQSIGDVIRVGVARSVAETRPGLLVVSLAPDAMQAPSVMYNLQRLYLAYSAATEYQDEVSLELRQGTDLYGWFTRQGLREARSP